MVAVFRPASQAFKKPVSTKVLPLALPKKAVPPKKTLPASPVVKAADKTAGNWLVGLLSGSGNSTSQIIVSAVLGCVPGVGQLFDLRDIVIGVVAVSAAPNNVGTWVDLTISLIGCIPALGDAFKAAFKLARAGKGADRVFDAIRKYAKVDPKTALATINWNSLQKQTLQILNDVLNSLIGIFDNVFVKQVIDAQNIKQTVQMMRKVQKEAPKMIDRAFKEIKKEVDKLLKSAEKAPATTAVSPKTKPLATSNSSTTKPTGAGTKPAGAGTKPAGTGTKPAGASHTSQPAAPKLKKDQTVERTEKKQATREALKKESDQIRQAKRKRWSTGVPAEHIVDYYVKGNRRSLRKINDYGRLIEEHDRIKRNADGERIRNQDINQTGIDHLWFGAYKGRKYLVGETKGSIFGHFAFLAGMATTDAQAIKDNRTETGKILNSSENYNAGLELPERKTSTDTVLNNEESLFSKRRLSGLSGTKTKGRQMSHKWIEQSLLVDKSISTAHTFPLISAIKISATSRPRVPPQIYHREIYMVTGKQYEQHDRSKGSLHKIQFPIILIPDNILLE